jgi:mono/diheme cytochrome c family protein
MTRTAAATAGIAVVAALAVVVAGPRTIAAHLPTRLATLVGSEGVPAAYAGRTNPRAADDAAVREGAALFQDNCATCHGPRADGHGPASVGLDPPPANFRSGDVLARHSDAYLFFRVSEGKPGTAMPSFHGALAENERWAVIAYLRTIPHEQVLASDGTSALSAVAR